jgi:hypothetical protein
MSPCIYLIKASLVKVQSDKSTQGKEQNCLGSMCLGMVCFQTEREGGGGQSPGLRLNSIHK